MLGPAILIQKYEENYEFLSQNKVWKAVWYPLKGKFTNFHQGSWRLVLMRLKKGATKWTQMAFVTYFGHMAILVPFVAPFLAELGPIPNYLTSSHRDES